MWIANMEVHLAIPTLDLLKELNVSSQGGKTTTKETGITIASTPTTSIPIASISSHIITRATLKKGTCYIPSFVLHFPSFIQLFY